jgi:NAD(P)-dependent dehydrogenase (short-subunit alcohol dehydrogenase family)
MAAATSGPLLNRVAIVIGAGSGGVGWGNGKACAISFARAGAKVVAVDVNLAAAEETIALIRAENGTAEAVRADVGRSKDLEDVVGATLSRYGRIDILHYNVGIAVVGGCVELSEEDWNRALRVNVTGCFLACKHVLPVMEKQGSGVILTTGSIAASRWTGVDYISYYATKAALVQFTRAVAMRYASKGLRAVSLLPGLMNTPMIYGSGLRDSYAEGDVEKMLAKRDAQCPTGKMGDAWDVANAAVFLASDAAKYITATELVIDGGITAKFI